MKLDWMVYSFVADCIMIIFAVLGVVTGELPNFTEVAKMPKRRVFVGTRLFKVINFGTNGNAICDFLLVDNSNVGCISHGFLATGLIGQKGASDTLSHLIPSLGMILCKYVDEPYIAKKLKSMGYR